MNWCSLCPAVWLLRRAVARLEVECAEHRARADAAERRLLAWASRGRAPAAPRGWVPASADRAPGTGTGEEITSEMAVWQPPNHSSE